MIGKHRSYLMRFIPCQTTPYWSNQKSFVRVFSGIGKKLFHIQCNLFEGKSPYVVVFGRNTIALSGRTIAYTHFGPKELVSSFCRTSSMASSQIRTENKYFGIL